MKKLCVLTLSLLIAACGTMRGSHVDDAAGGAVVGGVLGALLGAAAGGRDATAVGAVVGAAVGSAIAVDTQEAQEGQRPQSAPHPLPPQPQQPPPPVVYYPAPYPYPYPAYPYPPPPVVYDAPARVIISPSFHFGSRSRGYYGYRPPPFYRRGPRW